MHHLLLACPAGGHGAATGADPAAAAPPMEAHHDGGAPVPGWSPWSFGAAAVEPAAPRPERSPAGCHDVFGHVCLAVLVAAMMLMVALALAPVVGAAVWVRRLPPELLDVGARAPPVSVRLSCLCVWRC
jgi:hypothetical protein